MKRGRMAMLKSSDTKNLENMVLYLFRIQGQMEKKLKEAKEAAKSLDLEKYIK